MLRKLGRSYPPQFELLPLFLLFAGVYLAATYYPLLPSRIPTHFDFWGVPDGWGGKDSIFALPVINAVVYVIITVISVLLATVKDPRKLINLPQKRKAALTDAQVERLRVFLNQCLFALKVLIQGMMVYLIYITIEIATGRAGGLEQYWFLFIIAIGALVLHMVGKSFCIATPEKKIGLAIKG